MSEYMVCKSDMRDLGVVLDTLEEMGCPRDAVEVHEKAVALNGYPHHATRSAHVIVRAGQHNRYDIGFEKTENGYEAYVNDMDQRRPFPQDILNGRMKRLYTKNMTVRTAKRQGWRVASCEEEGGKIKLRVLPR